MIEYPKATDFQKAIFIGTWGHSSIPIYDVPTMHSLNQLVGYVKHINAGNGTVLYRGQCSLYEKVVPSIKHDLFTEEDNRVRLETAMDAILAEAPLSKYLGLKNADVSGWNLFQKLVIEAVLQHYGATTYCVDFVDNHWTALWFGLYKWDKINSCYLLRNNSGCGEGGAHIIMSDRMRKKVFPPEPTFELTELSNIKLEELREHARHAPISFGELVRRNKTKKFETDHEAWRRACTRISNYNDNIDHLEKNDHLFLFLYVADTNVSNFRGVYMGEKTYTIDLRKALPSTFLRPCSQHGWVVRGKDVSYDFDSQISCVIRVNIDLAKEMLGSGTLLSQENFFPDETIDQGYNILLERQKGSRLKSKFEKVIPSEMITDFGVGK